MSTVWIVGKNIEAVDDVGIVWDVIAICSTEEIALGVAKDHQDYFIGPMVIDSPLPDQREEWTGCYYPAYR